MNSVSHKRFSAYGSVIETIKKTKDLRVLHFKAPNESSDLLWEYERVVYLEPTNGTGVILVKSKHGNVVKFLLDKRIALKPYVQFLVLSNCEEFNYSLYADTIRTTVCITPEIRAQKKAVFGVDRIHTFLFQNRNKNFYFAGEKHDFYELTFMDKGEMLCEVDSTQLHLNQQDILLLLPNQVHKMSGYSEKGLSFLTISFSMKNADMSRFDRKILKCDKRILTIIRNLIFEMNLSHQYKNEMVLSLLSQLLILLICSLDGTRTLNSKSNLEVKNKYIEKAIILINNSNYGDITLDQIAEITHVSKSYLTKLFVKEIGISIKQYIVSNKINKAKEMIACGENNFSEIASKLGYCSAAFFSEQFKSVEGVSPTEFAKSLCKY